MDEIEYTESIMTRFKLEMHESCLDDIGFDLKQIDELMGLYHKHAYDDEKELFEELIFWVKRSLKLNKEIYERSFGTKPNLKDARGVFARNRRHDDEARGVSRNSYKIYPAPECKNMGIQTW